MKPYDNLVADVEELQNAYDKLRGHELKFYLKRAANIERFALSLAKFKVDDEAIIVADIDFDHAPGWLANKKQLAKGRKVIIRDVSVDTNFSYGCQLEGRGPERSLFYMGGAWLTPKEDYENKGIIHSDIH